MRNPNGNVTKWNAISPSWLVVVGVLLCAISGFANNGIPNGDKESTMIEKSSETPRATTNGEAKTTRRASPPIPERRPIHDRWLRNPGARLGFWHAPDRLETRERTGATGYSVHIPLRIAMEGPERDQPVSLHDFRPPREWLRMGFVAERPLAGVRLHMSSAFEGAGGHVRLMRLDEDGTDATAAETVQDDARGNSRATLTLDAPAPPGRYALEIRAARKRVEVWPGEATRSTTWIEDPEATPLRQTGSAFRGTLLYADGEEESFRTELDTRIHCSLGHYGMHLDGAQVGMEFGAGLGEHNNPFFVRYHRDFIRTHPASFMAGPTGETIRTDGATGNPVPAVDDPVLTRLADAQIRAGIARFAAVPQLRYWVIAGEESYPDYFGMPPGDFRADSLRHYAAYRRMRGDTDPFVPSWIPPAPPSADATSDDPPPPSIWPDGFGYGGPDHDRWKEFREAALEERAAHYMQTFLSEDATRPILYPTHGNPFFSFGRGTMGHDPGGIARACDGFETGQITIDDDPEELNLLTLAHMTAYGKTVATPRLANKTLDPDAQGGGRTFSPAMLRRLILECVGMGIEHIGLVQWVGDLPDGEWHIRDTPAEDEARRLFAELRQAAPYLAGMSRLQPRVALFAPDAAWRRHGWNPRWTGFFQDALARHWQITVVGDMLLDETLPARVPVLVALDTPTLGRDALRRVARYLDAGGRLIVRGTFATVDEYGIPYPENDPDRQILAAHPGVIIMPYAETEERRTLTNRSSTVFGANAEVRTYAPAPFDAIAGHVASLLPVEAIRPIHVENEGGAVVCLPLTDGASLMAVLINRADEPAAVTVRASLDGNGNATETEGEWVYRQVAPGDPRTNPVSEGAWRSTLPPQGTALVWIYRPATVSENRADPSFDALTQARTALETFAHLECDIAHLLPFLDAANQTGDAGLDPKRLAMAARIVEALGVRIETRESDSGDLALGVRVYDSRRTRIEGATVTAQFVPGDGRAIRLRETAPGVYAASVHYRERPIRYEIENGQYAPLRGPVRLVVEARFGHREGGAMTTIHLGAR